MLQQQRLRSLSHRHTVLRQQLEKMIAGQNLTRLETSQRLNAFKWQCQEEMKAAEESFSHIAPDAPARPPAPARSTQLPPKASKRSKTPPRSCEAEEEFVKATRCGGSFTLEPVSPNLPRLAQSAFNEEFSGDDAPYSPEFADLEEARSGDSESMLSQVKKLFFYFFFPSTMSLSLSV